MALIQAVLSPVGMVGEDSDYLAVSGLSEQVPEPLASGWRWGGHGPAGLHVRIDTDARLLKLFWGASEVNRWPVAVGKLSTPTPHGSWATLDRGSWGGAFGARWMGLSIPWGRYGMHGTNQPGSIGGRYSAGCVRMFNQHVVRLFQYVSVGTPVVIVGESERKFGEEPRGIKLAHVGSDVLKLQKYLLAEDIYDSRIDGVFGMGTLEAVRNYQEDDIESELEGQLSASEAEELQLYDIFVPDPASWFEPNFSD